MRKARFCCFEVGFFKEFRLLFCLKNLAFNIFLKNLNYREVKKNKQPLPLHVKTLSILPHCFKIKHFKYLK